MPTSNSKTKFYLPILIFFILLLLIIFNFTSKTFKKEPETIKIGAILPLTGPASSFGQYVKEGIDLALEEINKKPNSRRLQVIFEDSKGNPSDAISAYNKLVNIEKSFIIIAALSSVASAIQPLATKTQTVQIYIDVVKPGVADGNWTFRFYPEVNQTAGLLAKFALSKGYRKAFILAINDAYGEASFFTFKRIIEEGGGIIIGNETYDVKQSDFRSIATKIKNYEKRIDVIYLNGYGSAFAQCLKQIREAGIQTPIVADVALGLPENQLLAGDAAEGVYYVDISIPDFFREKFKNKYGKDPSSDAAYSYDVLMILNSIINDTQNSTVNVHLIRDYLRNLKDYQGVTGKITMTPTGDAKLSFSIFQIKNKKPHLEYRE